MAIAAPTDTVYLDDPPAEIVAAFKTQKPVEYQGRRYVVAALTTKIEPGVSFRHTAILKPTGDR